jgi:hypothetical protein
MRRRHPALRLIESVPSESFERKNEWFSKWNLEKSVVSNCVHSSHFRKAAVYERTALNGIT